MQSLASFRNRFVATIGGVVGAGTGMAIGNSMQNNENQRYGD